MIYLSMFDVTTDSCDVTKPSSPVVAVFEWNAVYTSESFTVHINKAKSIENENDLLQSKHETRLCVLLYPRHLSKNRNRRENSLILSFESIFDRHLSHLLIGIYASNTNRTNIRK